MTQRPLAGQKSIEGGRRSPQNINNLQFNKNAIHYLDCSVWRAQPILGLYRQFAWSILHIR